jgi:hypothetical protein
VSQSQQPMMCAQFIVVLMRLRELIAKRQWKAAYFEAEQLDKVREALGL